MNRRRFLELSAATVLVGGRAAKSAPPLLALATCDTEARLAVVDVAAGRVVRAIPCLPDPRSVERVAARHALVCHTTVGAVSIVDGSSLTIRHVLHDFEQPRYTAAHPDDRHAFVTDSGPSEVVAVDLAAGRRLGHVRLGEWARHLSLDRSGRTLCVGLGSASDRVAVVDVSVPARPRLERKLRPPLLAHDVGFAPGGDVWVTSGETGAIAVYGPTGVVRQRLPADAAPQHVSFAPDAAYVTSGAAGTLHVVRLTDDAAIRTVAVPRGSYNVQAGHGLVLTASLDSGTLSILDRNATLLHAVRVASSSHDACFLG